MLGISQLVNHWLGTNRVAEMAERVAGRSRMQVWQRVFEKLPELGAAEGRGYLRARAIGVVREETARLAEQEGAPVARSQSQIEAAALDLLVKSICEQLQVRRLVGVRRAA